MAGVTRGSPEGADGIWRWWVLVPPCLIRLLLGVCVRRLLTLE